jgi:hypothetical protein
MQKLKQFDVTFFNINLRTVGYGMEWIPFSRIKQRNHLFYRSKSYINKQIVNDDVILLCSALHIGPTAYVLSNDLFLDHVLCDDMVLPIFETWKKSRVIRHATIKREVKATIKVKFV